MSPTGLGFRAGSAGSWGGQKMSQGLGSGRSRGKEDTPRRSKGSPEEGPRGELGVGSTGLENVERC